MKNAIRRVRRSPVWLAADGMAPDALRALLGKLRGKRLGAVKSNDGLDDPGPEILGEIAEIGALPFADVKLPDIPETNRRRARKLSGRGAAIITVMASSGVAGMRAAVEGAADEQTGEARAVIYAVGVLTSMKPEECLRIFGRTVADQQRLFFAMAREAGVDGLICAPPDVPIAHEIGWQGLIATPGVRSTGVAAHDQDRIGTPAGAITAGAHAIIMGRQITEAADPVAALLAVYEEIGFDWTR